MLCLFTTPQFLTTQFDISGSGRRNHLHPETGLGPRAAERGAVAILHRHVRGWPRSQTQISHNPTAHRSRTQRQTDGTPPAIEKILGIRQGGLLFKVHIRNEYRWLDPIWTTEKSVATKHQSAVPRLENSWFRRRCQLQAFVSIQTARA